jgi:hypothetical protein
VRREDPDPRDAGARELAAGDREVERVRPREAHGCAAVEGDVCAPRREHDPLALVVRLDELGAERRVRGDHRGPQLGVVRMPDLDRHEAIFSSGA